jgi:hypothetical protein
MSIMQTPGWENQQTRHGLTQNGLESVCHGLGGLAVFLLLYLVGVYQRTVKEKPSPSAADTPQA